jgi:hypothetical protein
LAGGCRAMLEASEELRLRCLAVMFAEPSDKAAFGQPGKLRMALESRCRIA